jgi:O-antigen/teichoic acid export membrane protein
MDLMRKAVQGASYVLAATAVNRVVGFITQIILARLLLPSDFGLIAIALLIIKGLQQFRHFGIGAAVIHKPDEVDKALNTAFILEPIIAVFLFIVVYFTAPWIAMFFCDPAITIIVQIFALMLLIQAFTSAPAIILEKELHFKKGVIPGIVATMTYSGAAILLALNGFGVWSLVYGGIFSAVIGLVATWYVSPWRPSFEFDVKIAKELFGYGKHILAASLLGFLFTNLDDAVIGKMLGMEALGFYAVAYTLANLPATGITNIVNRVSFPLYSKLQEDKKKLKMACLKTMRYVSMLSLPISFGLLVLAPTLVEVAYGLKWVPMIPALQILCIYGLARSIAAIPGMVFLAVGDPSIINKNALVNLIIISILIYPLTVYHGFVGTAIVVTIASVIGGTYIVVTYAKRLEERMTVILDSMMPAIVSSSFMSIGLFIIQGIGILGTSLMSLVLLLGLALVIYLISLILFTKKMVIEEIREMLRLFK